MGEQKNCQIKNLNYIFFADDKKKKTKWDNQPSCDRFTWWSSRGDKS